MTNKRLFYESPNAGIVLMEGNTDLLTVSTDANIASVDEVLIDYDF